LNKEVVVFFDMTKNELKFIGWTFVFNKLITRFETNGCWFDIWPTAECFQGFVGIIIRSNVIAETTATTLAPVTETTSTTTTSIAAVAKTTAT
jgi:hypothetical protein